MFNFILNYIFQIGMGIAVLYILYILFLADWIENKRRGWDEDRGRQSDTNKIALVKLVSNDPKDIELFITNNTKYLSMDMVKKLVAKIEDLRADRTIAADDFLKKRIENLTPTEEESIEQETHAQTIRS